MAPPHPGLASPHEDPDGTFDLMKRIGITEEDITSAIREETGRLGLEVQYVGLVLDLKKVCAQHGVRLPDVNVYDRYGDTPGVYFDLGFCSLESVTSLVAALKDEGSQL